MGNALFLSTDASLALPRYYDFSALDPFIATDGAAGSDGLDDVTTLIYDPQYRDVKLSFHVVDPTTYYGSPGSPVTLTLRANDTHPLQVVSQVNYSDPDPPPDGRTNIVLTLLQSNSTVDTSEIDHRTDSIFPTRNLSGYWVLQVVQDLLTLEMTPAKNTDGTVYPTVSLSARLVPDTAGSISTSSVFILAFANSVTLTDLAMDYPTLLSLEITPSSTRQPRTARATATDFVVTSAAATATAIRTQRIGALAATAKNINVHAAMAHSTRSRRTGVISLSYPPPPEDDDSATLASTRAPRVASATGTSVVVNPDPATAASVRSPRTAALTARSLDASGILQLVGELDQDQDLGVNYIIVIQHLAGALSQSSVASAIESFLTGLVGELNQPQSATGQLSGLGHPITPTLPDHVALSGLHAQPQLLVGEYIPLGPIGQVVSGVSLNTPGQRGDPGYPGVAVMTPREYDTRDGEHKPDTETGFGKTRNFERRPISTHEQLWSYPGSNPMVDVVGPPYRTLRHAGTLTELAFSATSVVAPFISSGFGYNTAPTELEIGLVIDGKQVLIMVVPFNRVSWSIPLDIAYVFNQSFAPVLLNPGPGVTDMVVHLFFKQQDWVRDQALSTAG